MRIITLVIILCLFVIPLDIQPAPSPMPVGGHVVVEVVDAFTHTRIPDATIAVWYDNTRYLAGYCVRTDDDMLVTEWTHYCNDELLFVVWHEDYYLNSIQYTVPYFNDPYDITQWYFMARIELFKKSINVTADIYPPVGGFPINVSFYTGTYLGMTITVPEENGVFGMAHDWLILKTGYVYSKGVVIVSSNRTLGVPHKYEWQTANRFYYAFEMGRLYRGNSVIRIPITMGWLDCEIGVSVVDTVRFTNEGLLYHHNASTFVYTNETLYRVGDVQVEYGYQPSYVYPARHIALEDLRIVWETPDNTGGRPWPDIDWVDLYTVAVIAVCAIFVIYVAYRMMKNQDPVHLHYLLNCNNTFSE